MTARGVGQSVARGVASAVSADGASGGSTQGLFSFDAADAVESAGTLTGWVSVDGNRTMRPLENTGDNATAWPSVSGGAVTFSNGKFLVPCVRSKNIVTLPDATGSTAGKGFPITGLTYDSDRNRLWAINVGDNNGNNCTLVEMPLDASEILTEINLSSLFPSLGSVQGLAFDSSDNTLWFASYSENLLRNISRDGVSLDSFATDAQPNGLAYRAADDTLAVTFVGSSFKIYNASDGTVASTPGGIVSDGLVITNGGNYLGTVGNNGDQSRLTFQDIDGTSTRECERIEDCLAVEHLALLNGSMAIANNAHFHTVAPNLNQIHFAGQAFPDDEISVIDFLMVFTLTGIDAGSRALVTIANPLDNPGVGFYIQGTVNDSFRLITNTASGTTQRVIADTAVAAMITKSCIRVRVDLPNNIAKLYQNGVAVDESIDISGSSGNSILPGIVTVGASARASVFDWWMDYNGIESAVIAKESELIAKHSL